MKKVLTAIKIPLTTLMITAGLFCMSAWAAPTTAKNPLAPTSNNEPTFIDSDTLTINNETRVFTYSGNVMVRQGDMTLTAKKIEGTYSEKNELLKINAYEDIVIQKGAGTEKAVKAEAQHATYDAPSGVAILTENPTIEQNGSLLTADTITVYMNENRSEASGQVRVKLLKRP
jgi:lipopolysaccharide export system protein LptA